MPLARPSLLKIDVQGFELEVLKGVTALLPEIDAVYVEASFVELYEGQALHEEIERHLQAAGFRLDECFNEHIHQGERIQADLLFRGGRWEICPGSPVPGIPAESVQGSNHPPAEPGALNS